MTLRGYSAGAGSAKLEKFAYHRKVNRKLGFTARDVLSLVRPAMKLGVRKQSGGREVWY